MSIRQKMMFGISAICLGVLINCAGTQIEGPPKPPDGYWNMTTLKVSYALGLLDLVEKKPAIPAEIMVFKDISYKIVGSDSLKLNIYSTKGVESPRPVIIFIHGGAWKHGKREDYLPYIIPYTRRGYITATVSYRLAPEFHFPSAVEDVKCAIRWVRAHAAEYKIDPQKIALLGGSAGSHLAMMAAYSDESEFAAECPTASYSSKVKAIVAIYGPADFSTDFLKNNPLVHNFLGKKYEEAPELYEAASPVNYLDKDDPPTLIFHGTIDDVVPVNQSDILKKRLDEFGVENEYHRLEGWPHVMDLVKPVNEYTQYYITKFLNRHISFND